MYSLGYCITQCTSTALFITLIEILHNGDMVTYLISIVSRHYSTGMKISVISVLRYMHITGDVDITGK